MAEIIVKTQAELDALPPSFKDYTVIKIQSPADVWINVRGARESSHVVAWGSSHVVAWGSSHVVAWGSSHVVARESSHVVAWGSSHVVAWGSSHVVARGSVAVHNHSDHSTVILFAYAVAFLIDKTAKAAKKSKTCTVIQPKQKPGTNGWLESQAIKPEKKVIVFKKVSKDFKTQEKTENETEWKVGSTVTMKDWMPEQKECGEGKFHACSRPYFCDEFRNEKGDRYVAIEVAKEDLYAWRNPSYPHKIAFRKGKVLHECDQFGKQIA